MTRANYIRLYKNHKNGKIGYWEAWTEGRTLYMQHATGLNDQPQLVTETIFSGKQGRSIEEQAAFRLRSRANSKIDAGYVASITEASSAPTDADGKTKPMLAQKFKDYKKEIDTTKAYVQLKYNGHRCVIMMTENGAIAYSRNGKPSPGAQHILDGISLPVGTILDGEIYCHGLKLQNISSLVRKNQSESKSLYYVLFDVIVPRPFSERFVMMQDMRSELGASVKLAPTRRLDQISSIDGSLKKALESGYEGLIVRLDGKPYECGRRSDQVLKLKQFMDDEFTVIDVLKSKDGWGILVCQLPNGDTFKASAPGTVYEKEYVLRNKDKYIGKRVTIEFAEYTSDGKPFQPIATHWESVK